MADSRTLEALVLVFAPLSLVSIGGGPAALAEMQHQAVVIHGWVTQREFADFFALSRAAPGPGALLATLVGWKAAGWLGALVVSIAFFVPSSLLVFGIACLQDRWRGSSWYTTVEAGLAPMGVGLIFAGAYVTLGSNSTDLLALGTILSVAVLRIWWPSLHPLFLLGLGAVVFLIERFTR
jgi:chromate transporter